MIAFLDNWRLPKKLLAAFSILGLLLCVVGFNGYYSTRTLDEVAQKDPAQAGWVTISVQPTGKSAAAAAESLNNKLAGFAFRLSPASLTRLGWSLDDVAPAVRFLCGPESSWITGVCLQVDGGHHLRCGPDYGMFARMMFSDTVDPRILGEAT